MTDHLDKLIDQTLTKEVEYNGNIEDKVMSSINKKFRFRLKRIISVAALIILSITIVFAASQIIFNEDGSVTMTDNEKNWTIIPSGSAEPSNDHVTYRRIRNVLEELDLNDDELAMGYLNGKISNTNNEYVNDKKSFLNHDVYDTRFDEIFEYLDGKWFYRLGVIRYSLDKETFDNFEKEATTNHTEDEVYYKIIDKPNDVGSTTIKLTNNDHADLSISLSEAEYSFYTSGNNETFEVVTYDGIEILIEHLKENRINVSTIVDSTNIFISADLNAMTMDEVYELISLIKLSIQADTK